MEEIEFSNNEQVSQYIRPSYSGWSYNNKNRNAKKITEQSIIVVGIAGAGKTSIINYLCGDFDFSMKDAGMSGESVTKDVNMKTSPIYTVDGDDTDQYRFTLYDTQGFGSDDIVFDVIREALTQNIQRKSEIHKILIVIKMERFRNEVSNQLTEMINFIKKFEAQNSNFCLLLTHTDPWHKNIITDYLNNLIDKYELGFIPKENITFGCFAILQDLDEKLLSIYEEKRNESITKLHGLLRKTTAPFDPLKGTIAELQNRIRETEISNTQSQDNNLQLYEEQKRINEVLLSKIQNLEGQIGKNNKKRINEDLSSKIQNLGEQIGKNNRKRKNNDMQLDDAKRRKKK